MGYRISVINSEFFIADQDKYAAFKKLKSVYGGQPWFKDCRCLERIYMKDISDRIEKYSLEQKIVVCDMIVSLLDHFDKVCSK